ncbi:hypothetical protein NP493_608g02025 [Ridgeia piscesae]|uniref:Uncharacterized protein n=1 Tax=Ridgeia piscesae TaxID=27915 RepID=A0AAD9KTQ1_RIDPI|nr:hypothetical protein NP493_608g02025 [Ridgeia piscesae]
MPQRVDVVVTILEFILCDKTTSTCTLLRPCVLLCTRLQTMPSPIEDTTFIKRPACFNYFVCCTSLLQRLANLTIKSKLIPQITLPIRSVFLMYGREGKLWIFTIQICYNCCFTGASVTLY